MVSQRDQIEANDSTYSTLQQKNIVLKKKQGSFRGNTSTCPKKRFFQEKYFNMAQKVVLSAEKIQHVPKDVLLSTEMLNMLNHVGSSV